VSSPSPPRLRKNRPPISPPRADFPPAKFSFPNFLIYNILWIRSTAMNVELNQRERDALAQLVDAALREIGPEIRHTRTNDYKDDLKVQRETLRHLHERLTADNPEVLVGGV
jgi:hypothetical protein